MPFQRFFQGTYYDNLGLDLTSGVLTVRGASGRDLSSANPAVVVIPSTSNQGQFNRYLITSNSSFTGSSGTSDIINNLFGTAAGVAMTNTVPFYLYMVQNTAEDTVQPMLCRVPRLTVSPPASDIGKPSNAIADNIGSFWSLDDVTVSNFADVACVMVGKIRLKKNASDDWQIIVIDEELDGIGFFPSQFDSILTTSTSEDILMRQSYMSDNSSTVTYTVPTTPRFGEEVSFINKGTGNLTIAVNSGQQIHFGATSSTVSSGTITANDQFDSVSLRCIEDNGDFVVTASSGSWTIT